MFSVCCIVFQALLSQCVANTFSIYGTEIFLTLEHWLSLRLFSLSVSFYLIVCPSSPTSERFSFAHGSFSTYVHKTCGVTIFDKQAYKGRDIAAW